MRAAAGLLALAALLATGGCDREERQLAMDAAGRRRALAPSGSGLFHRPDPAEATRLPDPRGYEPHEGNAQSISEGQRLFSWYNCAGCHSIGGGGGMGPPLIDAEWRYGSRPEEIYATIAQGRPRGMPTFGRLLPEDHVWKLVAYVRALAALEREDAIPARADRMQDVEGKHE
jgi:cytochrome c oxidase cbb3-type subunit 3